ncbi:Citrate (pro-3S)-lyase [Methylorubrum populi BJ001]|jgi:citrate lyase subunit beta/citryl-CoA lyase|uniref:Citrate (Pro-3S)-lyase n=1 Tax=Methylorubrum populi (strain ATCC BAA-705 / NCIMB 13946 / BJ001) TaxID=441620 RepID=B1ZCR4_METPB|nr:CoA ester lyase [Methylorubrum populi]ACB79426.1 Citrate (pro-3S)-lyase [Methylorubrum populi BJ001]OAH37121.1 aldolase [Methylorubrum populi]PZP69576.1 MAG: CoA ester lyase [Methylorubrum populi]
MKLRTLLFCPADAERKIARALGSSADVVILDLEDSVAARTKEAARSTAAQVLAGASGWSNIVVRINPQDTPWYLDDLATLVPQKPTAIVLPKCSAPEDLQRLDHHLEVLEHANGLPPGMIGILPLVTESATALQSLNYGYATSRLRALLFGAEDLAVDFGIAPRSEDGALAAPLAAARAMLLVAAAQAQVPAIDTPWPNPHPSPAFDAEVAAAVRDGFAGKLCIHPNQLEAVATAFTPSPERVRWAQSVYKLFMDNPGSGVMVLDGEMIDRPHMRLAERILDAAADASP